MGLTGPRQRKHPCRPTCKPPFTPILPEAADDNDQNLAVVVSPVVSVKCRRIPRYQGPALVSLESGEDVIGLRLFLLAIRFADHPASLYSLQLQYTSMIQNGLEGTKANSLLA